MSMTVTNLRMSTELHEALKSIARSEERSLNNLIVRTLNQMVEEWPRRSSAVRSSGIVDIDDRCK